MRNQRRCVGTLIRQFCHQSPAHPTWTHTPTNTGIYMCRLLHVIYMEQSDFSRSSALIPIGTTSARTKVIAITLCMPLSLAAAFSCHFNSSPKYYQALRQHNILDLNLKQKKTKESEQQRNKKRNMPLIFRYNNSINPGNKASSKTSHYHG